VIALEGGRQTVYAATSYGQAICEKGKDGKSVNVHIYHLKKDILELIESCDRGGNSG